VRSPFPLDRSTGDAVLQKLPCLVSSRCSLRHCGLLEFRRGTGGHSGEELRQYLGDAFAYHCWPILGDEAAIGVSEQQFVLLGGKANLEGSQNQAIQDSFALIHQHITAVNCGLKVAAAPVGFGTLGLAGVVQNQYSARSSLEQNPSFVYECSHCRGIVLVLSLKKRSQTVDDDEGRNGTLLHPLDNVRSSGAGGRLWQPVSPQIQIAARPISDAEAFYNIAGKFEGFSLVMKRQGWRSQRPPRISAPVAMPLPRYNARVVFPADGSPLITVIVFFTMRRGNQELDFFCCERSRRGNLVNDGLGRLAGILFFGIVGLID